MVAALAAACIPPDWGANALLHPYRRHPTTSPRDVGLSGEAFEARAEAGAILRGWVVRAAPGVPRRGLLIYLHGVADNRQSGLGVAARLWKSGWDVAAYDARAHGDSDGEFCTYGAVERRDVGRVLDALAGRGVDVTRTVLLGTSMGGAVALQASPGESRVHGVITDAAFADLWTAAHDRKPYIMSESTFRASLRRAEEIAHFRVADVSPEVAARSLHVPLLLLHGEDDDETPPSHSRRIARADPSARLVLVRHAGHNGVLGRPEAWQAITEFLSALP